MLGGMLALAAAVTTGAVGNLDRAAPHLAALLAAGAMWTIGYVSARRRGMLDPVWSALVWSSLAYCIWIFLLQIVATLAGIDLTLLADSFESPAAAALLFGLLALLGSSRILHVVKRIDAEALDRSAMIDRLMRDALGGMLLLGFALTCVVMAGSEVGFILTAAVLLGHATWDTAPIARRPHRAFVVRVLHHFAPLAAIGLAGWGIALAWLMDESVTSAVGVSDAPTHIQRLGAYVEAWLRQPVFGYGLGSIDAVGAEATTLFNARAMLAPGDAQNVFVRWLVESGVVGLSALVIAFSLLHGRIAAAMKEHRAPSTFARLAFAAGALMLLHGVTDSSLDLPSAFWFYALLLGAASGVATVRRSGQRTSSEPVKVSGKKDST
jgi:hypothetical protein